MLIRNAFALVNRLLPAEEASAHCDIPCGIYDPHHAQMAAQTVIRMNMLMADLAKAPPSPAEFEQQVRSRLRFAPWVSFAIVSAKG